MVRLERYGRPALPPERLACRSTDTQIRSITVGDKCWQEKDTLRWGVTVPKGPAALERGIIGRTER